MKITLNGETVETDHCSLEELLVTFNYQAKTVATAINGEFVPVDERPVSYTHLTLPTILLV